MLTFHELMGFMSPKMANQILDDTQTNNKDVYRALLASMAQVLKARPEFLSRQLTVKARFPSQNMFGGGH